MRSHFNEKPSIIPGCPGVRIFTVLGTFASLSMAAAYILIGCLCHRPGMRHSSRTTNERAWWQNGGDSDESDDELFGSHTDSGSNFY